MKQVEVNGGAIAYVERGSGPKMLLIHGFPFDLRLWTEVEDLLASTHTLITPDLRGRGSSSAPALEVNAMEQMADDLSLVLEVAGAVPVHVVGHSMGGYVALAIAERYPAMVGSLTLVSSKAGADTDAGREGRNKTIAGLNENGRQWLGTQLLPKLVPPDASPAVVGKARTMIEDSPYEAIIGDLAGMRDRPDRTSVLNDLAVPKLVLVGELDALIPAGDGEAMASAAGAEFLLVPGRAHLLPIEDPAAVADALRSFAP
jgi:pimeloyl-ACP methyl ester carboxylesterase